MIGVLILINEHIAKLLLIIVPDIRILLQQPHTEIKQILKVHGIGILEPPGIGSADLGGAVAADVAAETLLLHILLGRKHGILIPGGSTQHSLGRVELLVHVQLLQQPLHHGHAVGGIVDGKVLCKTKPVGVPAQDAGAGAMEGHGPDVPGRGTQAVLQPGLQLAGGLVGKGDGDDLPGSRNIQGTESADLIGNGLFPGGSRLQLM